MLASLDVILLPTIFFIFLGLSVLSGLFLLYPKVPLNFIPIHVGIISLPPIVALMALIFDRQSVMIGPWRFDALSWLLACFVLFIGLIVQRYSVRYLLGDRSYRKYFALLTFTTVADSMAWLSDDLRWLLICWGLTLLGLTLLIRLRKEWLIAKNAARLTGRLFTLGWFILLLAIIWIWQATGDWQLSLILSPHELAAIDSWERFGIGLLLIAAVMIPAAQWPFQRWLLDTAIVPTPVSAVMHAGIVNAGGILLTRFAPLFSGDVQMILLVLSGISVLMGTGIMLVQVDYKRQLVGSTIAQMGFMLFQCALGAYWAAITHAVLHGLFKATLFLLAGSAVRDHVPVTHTPRLTSSLWATTGIVLGLFMGIYFWFTSGEEPYQMISAIILGLSVAISWEQLVAYSRGWIGKIAGITIFVGAAIVFNIIHIAFYKLLHDTVMQEMQSFAPPAAIFLMFILLIGSALGIWLVCTRSLPSFVNIYLWLLRLSEPQNDSFESHPKYLTQLQSRGGRVYDEYSPTLKFGKRIGVPPGSRYVQFGKIGQ